MICKLRRIAVSMTGEECDKAIDDLKESAYWSGKLQEYMEIYWLPIKKVYLLILLNYHNVRKENYVTLSISIYQVNALYR